MIKPYYQENDITIYNCNCNNIIDCLPIVDLVLTDPPYGIGENAYRVANKGKLAKTTDYGNFDWDKRPIKQSLINKIINRGKYQCLWGGNYYSLPPCKGPLIWDKENNNNDFADGEMAWNNYGSALRIKKHLWNGMIRKNKENRFHPTQKPLGIIMWCISLCPINVKSVLDPFMGSGTTLRAAKDLNISAIGIEKEKKYCDIAIQRLSQEVLQL